MRIELHQFVKIKTVLNETNVPNKNKRIYPTKPIKPINSDAIITFAEAMEDETHKINKPK